LKTGVQEGGYNIPREVIERRYLKGIYNLFDIYLPLISIGFNSRLAWGSEKFFPLNASWACPEVVYSTGL